MTRAYPTRDELITQARAAASYAIANRKGTRHAAVVYVSEQLQRMYDGRDDRFRHVVTTSHPTRWLVRDGNLSIVERVVMQAPWSAATDEATLAKALLESVCVCSHPKTAHGAGGCAAVMALDTMCALVTPCRAFTPLASALAGAS